MRGQHKLTVEIRRIVRRDTYLDLKEVLWLAVDLLEALLTRIWHGLHCNGSIGGLRATFTYECVCGGNRLWKL